MKSRFLFHIKKLVVYKIFPFILHLYTRFVYLTSKKNFYFPEEKVERASIFTVWHGELMMLPFMEKEAYKRGIVQKNTVHMISSLHQDARIGEQWGRYLGSKNFIFGSSAKGGTRALIKARSIIKDNGHVLLAINAASKGHIHAVSNGTVALAEKTDAHIIAITIVPTRYWRWKSWDKFLVLKPFGVISFYMSKPFSIKGLDSKEAKERIKEKMLEYNIDSTDKK